MLRLLKKAERLGNPWRKIACAKIMRFLSTVPSFPTRTFFFKIPCSDKLLVAYAKRATRRVLRAFLQQHGNDFVDYILRRTRVITGRQPS